MIDADAVTEAQLEYLRNGGTARPKRERALLEKLMAATPKLAKAEADMRRAFRRWEKYRSLVERIDKQLEDIERAKFEVHP